MTPLPSRCSTLINIYILVVDSIYRALIWIVVELTLNLPRCLWKKKGRKKITVVDLPAAIAQPFYGTHWFWTCPGLCCCCLSAQTLQYAFIILPQLFNLK